MNGFYYLRIVFKNIYVWIFSMYCSASVMLSGSIQTKINATGFHHPGHQVASFVSFPRCSTITSLLQNHVAMWRS